MAQIPTSTLSANRRNIANIQETNAAVNKQYKKISSGKAAQNWSELPAYEGAVLQEMQASISNSKARIDLYNAQNRKMEATLQSLQNIHQIFMRTMGDLMYASNSAVASSMPIQLIARQNLEDLKLELSTNYEGDYIFGGHKTNLPPINDIVTQSNLSSTRQPTNSYYRGDYPNGEIVTAGDPLFQNAIGALNLAQSANPKDLRTALDWLQDSDDELIIVITEIGYQLKNNRQKITNENDTSDFLTAEAHKVIGIDIPTEMIKLEYETNVLNATFMATAKTQNLSLTQYLR